MQRRSFVVSSLAALAAIANAPRLTQTSRVADVPAPSPPKTEGVPRGKRYHITSIDERANLTRLRVLEENTHAVRALSGEITLIGRVPTLRVGDVVVVDTGSA